jgi:hypothetical protein
MVIDFGEAEVFEWEMAQAIHCFVGSERSFAYLLEQLANGFGVQGKLRARLSVFTGRVLD